MVTQREMILAFIMSLCVSLLTSCATMSTTREGSSLEGVAPKVYSADYDKVFMKAVDAVSQCSWQITFTDKSTGVISAKTPTNLWTWGDNVSIRIQKIDNDKVRVDVSSGTPNQVVDWGRNSRNITKYFKSLDLLLSESK